MSLLQNSNAISTGGAYNLESSLRFRSSATAYLRRTPASASNRTVWTLSCWVKKSSTGSYQNIFSASNETAYEYIRFRGDNDSLDYGLYDGGTINYFKTNAIFRDPSAWYHIVVARNSSTPSLYINGEQVTSFASTSASSNNGQINNNVLHEIGSHALLSSQELDGYMTEVNFVDGQALDADDFGEYDDTTGVWKPKKYTGTYGTNGFYLPMKDFGLPISSTSGPGFSTYAGSFTSGLSINGTHIELPDNSTNLAIGTNDFTIEGWVYTTKNGRGSLMGIGTANSSGAIYISWESDTESYINLSGTNIYTTTSAGLNLSTSGWSHIALTRSGSTVNLYKNGSLVISGTSSANLNLTDIARVGTLGSINPSSYTIQGEISNLRLVIGTALYTGSSYTVPTSALTAITGTQLLTLQDSTLQDNSSNNYSMTVKYPYTFDTSGNNNDWRSININIYTDDSTYDIMNDVPTLTDEDTGNFCTLNPNDKYSMTVTEGNLRTIGTADYKGIRGTMALPATGKFYWETYINRDSTVNVQDQAIGLCGENINLNSNPYAGTPTVLYYPSGYIYINNSAVQSGVTTATIGDIIGVAVNMDDDEITFYKNGSQIGSTQSISSITGYTLLPFWMGSINRWSIWNFGQRPFKYTPPTGYKKLNTYNLPDSTIKDGSQYMNTVTYTGNGSTQSITGVGFSPDLVWVKNRNSTQDHSVYDTVRGISRRIYTNGTFAEDYNVGNGITSFDSDGWTTGSLAGVNTNTYTYASWNWRGSDSTAVSNTDGTITSTVSANTTSGFSVVTYTATGNGSDTVGHGLGTAPKVVLLKSRSTTGDWIYYTTQIDGSLDYLYLNQTAAKADSGWTVPSSTVFPPSNTANGTTMVAYCFAEVEGFSKFGSYTGNGSTDGPFVYTGFRPAFVLFKRTDSTGNWYIFDVERNTYNLTNLTLFPNLSGAESLETNNVIDILSNGFKHRATGGFSNASGGTYIYMCFASNPFKQSLAR